ncbi:MAG: F-box protein, partial [Verrucomicrobia bacterium]|nr:F-box protein [Verrucomicrobiota bacterium]
MGNCISGVKIGDFSKIKTLPLELQVEVFSYLKPSELRAVCLTDKIKNQIINNSDLKKESIYRDFAFNSGDWKKFCKKDVDMEKERSSLPRDI